MGVSGIDVRGLTVGYGGQPVLTDVTLAVPAGRVVGVIGPNGAGKSTLVKAVLGLLRPAEGSIRINGSPPEKARPGVAYVAQRSTADLDYPIEVGELVAMGCLPRTGLFRGQTAADHRSVADAIARVGLAGLERKRVGALSGGQQQRANLARVVAQQAPVHVLDEPLAGLDRPTIELAVDLLRELAADGAAVLVVLHELSLLTRTCDDVVLLRETVVTSGPPDQVLADVRLAQAYGFGLDAAEVER